VCSFEAGKEIMSALFNVRHCGGVVKLLSHFGEGGWVSSDCVRVAGVAARVVESFGFFGLRGEGVGWESPYDGEGAAQVGCFRKNDAG
jgi:hypothetical protein